MADLGMTFDPNTVEPAVPMEMLPPGEYPVMITESSLDDTKAMDGKRLNLTFTIIDGPAKGRKLWDGLNLINKNPQAQEIAHRAFSAICHAVGSGPVRDSALLHEKPLMATVQVKPANGQYAARNEIKGYKSLSGGAARVAATPQATPAQSKVPAWRRAAG